jgi:hypothetical protein
MLKGKTKDQNLVSMFKVFYDSAKSSVQDGSGDFINSARSSVGSLGGKLEQRRQAMR